MSRYILKYCAPINLWRYNQVFLPGPGVIRQLNSQICKSDKFHRDLTDYNFGQISFDVRHIYPYGLSSGADGPYVDFFVLTDNYFVSIEKIGQFITSQMNGDWGRCRFDFVADGDIYTIRLTSVSIKFELRELLTEESYMKIVRDFDNWLSHADSYYEMTDPMNYVSYDRYELEEAIKALKDLERTLVG